MAETAIGNSSARPVAWVTGGGRGIGRGLAIRLEKEGWQVAISSRTPRDLKSISQKSNTDKIFDYPLDVTDSKSTIATVEKIERELGQIELTVLNAGTFFPMSVEDFSADKFKQLVDTNLMGPVNGLAQIIPRYITRRGGTVAIVSSLAGYRGLPTSSAYGATKAALINMCESLKIELENYNVKLILINPGFVKTPLTDKNNFYMPFLIPVETAVEHIMNGLKTNKFEITFPFKFAMIMKCLRIMPYRLYFCLTRWMAH